MKEIADEHGLELDDVWNKEMLPHQGRHPSAYHEFVLEGMRTASRDAGGNTDEFLRLFDTYVKEPVRQNPQLLRKEGWEG